MKKYLIAASFILASLCSQAQPIHVPVGKKFQLTLNNTSTIAVTIMGQSMDNTTDMNIVQEYTVQSIQPSGYTLLCQTTKVSGLVRVMGQEQKFDSDDEASKNHPQLGKMFTELKQPKEIVVENGKVKTTGSQTDLIKSLGMGPNVDDLSGIDRYFFSLPLDNLKQGQSWSDSLSTGSIKMVNQYIITEINGQEFTVRVSTDTKMDMDLKQNTVEVQTDMKGYSTSTRVYDRKTGMLKNEKVASEMTGTTEAMGVKAPMTIKSTIMTTLN